MERIPLNQDITVEFDGHSFTIDKCIGQGNSSLVYLAQNEDGLNVVLKEIYPVGLGIGRKNDNSLVIPQKSRDAFAFYCENAKVVVGTIGSFYNNPQTNNSTIFAFASDSANNTFYYSSAWSSGNTLAAKLDDSGFSLAALIQVCKSIADTLQTYHDKKYIHTDIKPQNVFIRVGVILYKRLFGRLPEEYLYQPSFVPDYSKCEELQKYSPELKGILTKIFNGTLSLLIDDRYQTAKALAKDLGKAHKIAGKELFVTDMDIRPGDENLVERNEELIAIHKMLAEKKAVFITGLGGCGKTTLAQQYAAYYRDEYSVIQEVVFDDSLKETIENKLRISTSKDMSCEDKINHVLRMTSSDTLIIIDDVTLKESDGDVLKELLNISAPVRFIFTSREKWDGSLSNLSNYICFYEADNYPNGFKEAAVKLFFDIAGEESRSYEKDIKDFLESIDYHIMTVQILAVYTNELISYNPDNLRKMLEILRDDGISAPKLNKRKKSPYNSIKTIFKNTISEESNYISSDEKFILQNASILPHEGMKRADFESMLEIETDEFTGSEHCDELVRKSLLKRKIINGTYHISMHPIIREVCVSELIFETQKPFNFNPFIRLLKGLSSKLDLSAGNTEYIFLSLAVCNNLSELSKAKNTELSPAILPLIENIKNKGINYKDQMKLLSSILCDENKGVLNPLLTNFADFFKINS